MHLFTPYDNGIIQGGKQQQRNKYLFQRNIPISQNKLNGDVAKAILPALSGN